MSNTTTAPARSIDESRFDAFMALLEAALRENIAATPDKYRYTLDDLPAVLVRFRAAILTGNYDKDGPACKAACKRLGIRPTFTAIDAYLAGN